MSLKQLLDVPAPAKLNLFLHVVGRREDGYHLLQSVFRLIDWCDTLHFERRADGRISRTDLGPALPADDLSVRAAQTLQRAAGITDGVHISIDKQVPWGAGLGGGSSDAATTLLALNRLWGLHWPRARLLPIALQLGADVPFFVGGRNAWVEGIGEQLSPIDLAPEHYVVIKPSVEIPTAKIFSSPLLRRDTKRSTIAFFLADTKSFGNNDLQPCAIAHSQEVGQALNQLAALFGTSRMSGSGSAVFASAGSNPDMIGLQQDMMHLATMHQSWQIRLCRGLKHHPLLDWASD